MLCDIAAQLKVKLKTYSKTVVMKQKRRFKENYILNLILNLTLLSRSAEVHFRVSCYCHIVLVPGREKGANADFHTELY